MEEERGGGDAWTCPPPPPPSFFAPPHTLVSSSCARLASHWLSTPAIYLCDWSGRGIYAQHGSVKSGHKFLNVQTGQTDRETASGTVHVTEELWANHCTTHSKQELFEGEKREKGRIIVDHFQGEYPDPQLVCFLFLSRFQATLRSRCFALEFVLQIHQIPLLIFHFVPWNISSNFFFPEVCNPKS